MKKRIFGLILFWIWMVLLGQVTAGEAVSSEPNNIGELLKAKGVEWLTDKWEATTDKGEKAQAEFTLEMDGYVICCDARVEQNKYRGLMFYVPSKGHIVNAGADNRGGNFAGTCEIKDGKLVMNLELTTADGAITKFTRYLSRIDSDTMKSETYVFVDGKRPEQPTGIFEFKRKK